MSERGNMLIQKEIYLLLEYSDLELRIFQGITDDIDDITFEPQILEGKSISDEHFFKISLIYL